MTANLGRTIAESTPSFAPERRPPAEAPNVVVIVLDDLGFGQLGCFGSGIGTPNIDRLADEGLRYTRFHVTALCSPTRACLLTGRNHHAVGMGFLTDLPTGFPGYTGRIPHGTPTMSGRLRDEGWSTFAVGKWHLAPRWEQSAAGPFSRWPLGLGFERYYGFLAGDTNQWTPDLVRDNGFIEAPREPAEGYHLTEDLADQAVRLIRDQQHATPDKPFFLYFAPGAVHAPHQAPPEWIAAQAGRFDQGWDRWRDELFERQVALGVVPPDTVLTPRPPWVEAWESMPEDRQRLSARFMEVFSAFLAHTDAQIGRLTAFLEELGQLDNTLVLLISDNGTSAEGGPLGTFNEHRFTHDQQDDLDDTIARIDDLGGFRAYNHYPWGWAWAGNTPLRLWKRYTWLGGVRTPLIVRWPGRVPRGEIRGQFAHAVDLLPTVLDACGLPPVDGLDGASLVPSFTQPAAPGRQTQYFEMLGSRAIYHDGWKATTDHVGRQLTVEHELLEGSRSIDEDRWSLFRLEDDFSESTDVADQHPDVLDRLVERWWHEAGKNQVLPLEDSFIARAVAMEPNPWPSPARRVFRPRGTGIAEDLLGPLGAGFQARAAITIISGAVPSGIICALGDWSNGFAWYLHTGRPVAAFNLFGRVTRVAGPDVIGAGEVVLGLDYERTGDDRILHVLVDDKAVARTPLTADLPFRWQIGGAGLLVGRDRGFPVCDDYTPPFEPDGFVLAEITFDYPVLGSHPPPAAEILHAIRFE